MATKIDQKAYLQKYLSGPSSDKKKKKKKITKGHGFKIIDDDLDLSKLRPLEGDELDILGEGEDAPQIAGIIDERPDEVKKLEQFKTTSKWRVINQDDGFNSKIQIEEIKKDVKEVEKENELIFGKMYSDSEDEQKPNTDLRPSRKEVSKEYQQQNKTSKKPLNHSDSDFSPPRKSKEDKDTKSKSKSRNNESDISPSRKKAKSKSKRRHKDSDSDLSPPRKNEEHKRKESKSIQQDNDSDLSPPRKSTKSIDRGRKPSRWGDFKEEQERYNRNLETSQPLYQRSSRSPDGQRNNRKMSSDSDMSPPRKTNRNNHKAYDSDLSPPRKTTKNYDSDLSPPRKSKQKDTRKRNKSPESDNSPSRKRKYSPQRQKDSKNRFVKQYTNSRSDKYEDGSNDWRRNNRGESSRYSKERDRRKINNSDQSPSRNKQSRDKRKYDRQSSDSPPPTNKKMEKTLEGKKAGLQDAMELRHENEAFRKREEEAFSKMTDEVLGKNAQVVSRKGKRENSEERRKQKEKAERQKELDEKYKRWGKGLKQIEDQEKRVQEFMHEASKPLARHKGDRDLEDRLKDVEREGDPMLQYMREKKRDRGELGPEKPLYKGSFPPNRFNIRPGYRWDGVDRSNGYEKKFFDQQSKRKAQAEESYKWSTEDL